MPSIDLTNVVAFAENLAWKFNQYNGTTICSISNDTVTVIDTPITILPEAKLAPGRQSTFSRATPNQVRRLKVKLNFPTHIEKLRQDRSPAKSTFYVAVSATGGVSIASLYDRVMLAKNLFVDLVNYYESERVETERQEAVLNQAVTGFNEKLKIRKANLDKRIEVYSKLEEAVADFGVSSKAENSYVNVKLRNGIQARLEASHDGIFVTELTTPVHFDINNNSINDIVVYLNKLAEV